jgi:hypothetical protein
MLHVIPASRQARAVGVGDACAPVGARASVLEGLDSAARLDRAGALASHCLSAPFRPTVATPKAPA